MNQSQYNQLFSFIWNIATDVLVYAFEKGEYKKIIMPMMVLRRIDVLLEPTKEALLNMKQKLDESNIQNQDPILYNVTGYPFFNTSKFTMKTLKSETDSLRLKMNFTDYLNGFSKDVQDIIDKFHLWAVSSRSLRTIRLTYPPNLYWMMMAMCACQDSTTIRWEPSLKNCYVSLMRKTM